jgi:AcrR family transcriptional regulator
VGHHEVMSATQTRPTTRAAQPGVTTALGAAAQQVLPTVQERRGTQIRDTKGVASRLTAAAIDLFATQGYDEITIADIAATAGVNKRTFFRYFPSKETLILDIWDQTNRSLIDLIDQIPTGEELLPALGRAVVQWCVQFEELMVGLANLTHRSRTLFSATLLHSVDWESEISQAVLHRFPELGPDTAHVAGILVIASLRAAQKRVIQSGQRYPAAVAEIFQAMSVLHSKERVS